MTVPPSGSASHDRQPGPDEISLVRLANGILRRRRLVVWTSLLVFLVVVTATAVRRRVYSSGGSFIPQSGQAVSGLSGLAAQFGLALPTAEAAQSPDFYANLIRSREVLGTIVETRYRLATDTGTVDAPLWALLDVMDDDSLRRHERAIQAVGDLISAAVDKRTGVVRFAVTTRVPALSLAIAVQVVEELHRFNLERRQSRAEAERTFMGQRLDEVRGDLRAAEDRLQAFLTSNRDYRNSPVLTFQQERLARDVAFQQQVYTTLSQAFEQAKIESMRDTPIITMVERPERPARPDPRGLLRRGVMALLGGLVLGILVAAGLDRLGDAERQEPGAYGEFAALRRGLIDDLRRPWRLFGRRAG